MPCILRTTDIIEPIKTLINDKIIIAIGIIRSEMLLYVNTKANIKILIRVIHRVYDDEFLYINS